MKIVTIIARVLLRLMFVVFGANAFLHFMPMPQMPDSPGTRFIMAMATTGYMKGVGAFELAGGLLLLLGRYVPLGLALLAPVMVNIAFFHAFMAPADFQMAVVVCLLEAFLIWRHRSAFAGLLQL